MTKITKTLFVTADKAEYDTQIEAMAHELNCLPKPANPEERGEWIVKNKDAILTILGARRRPRSDRGKPRKKPSPSNQAANLVTK